MTRPVPRPWLARARRRLLLPPALALLACVVARPAGAQRAEAGGGQEVCPQGRISSIFVDNHSVFDLSDPDLNERFDWAYRLANRLHRPTREEVVRREILFTEGDCYHVERLRDSERLLRSLSFIANVDIFGVQQPDGSIHVIVDTQDEWSTRVEPRLGSTGVLGLKGLRVREDNLLGSGQHVSAFFLNDEEKQVYGLSYHNPQLLDSRWDARLDVGKTPVGHLLNQAIYYPFVGQEGRWAFRQAVRHSDHFFEFWAPTPRGLTAIWFPERRQSADVGAALRLGSRGYNRTLLGAALTGEWISYPGQARFADPVPNPGSPPPLPGPGVDSIASVRLLLMTGQRNVSFVRRRALNTVNGTEDVRLGVEAEIALGPSLPGLSGDRDLSLDMALFAGGELPGGTLAGAHLLLEARRAYDAAPRRSEWNDVFAEVDAWAYWRPSPESRQILVGSVSAVGGWHVAVPFQLTLGGKTGMRGYPDHLDPGARRVVASLEHRSYLGWPLPQLFDLGAAAFLDVGRMWAGDAPFGVDSPVRADVGVGLRAAFPPGSRQTLRLDVAVPVRAELGWRDVVLTVGVGQRIGSRAAQRDPQLLRSARQGVATSVFLFPNQP